MLDIKKYKAFEGKIYQLERVLEECWNDMGYQRDSINIRRTIRYYIQERVLPPAIREGRNFTYNYEHILKFLYLRKQLNDGWPLNKIRDNAQYQNIDYFEEFFSDPQNFNTSNDPLNLIQEFKKTNRTFSKGVGNSKFNLFSSESQSGIPSTKDALKDINSDIGNVVKQNFTTLQLSTSLVLLIESNLMSNMNYDLAKKIGNAISAALFDKNPITMKDLQQIFLRHQEKVDQSDKIKNLTNELENLKRSLVLKEKEFALKEMERRTAMEKLETEFKNLNSSNINLINQIKTTKSHLDQGVENFTDKSKEIFEHFTELLFQIGDEDRKIYEDKIHEFEKILLEFENASHKKFSKLKDNNLSKSENSKELNDYELSIKNLIKNSLLPGIRSLEAYQLERLEKLSTEKDFLLDKIGRLND